MDIGGLFLMMVFFYFAFVFGAMFYVEVGSEDWGDDGSHGSNYCKSMQQCMYTLMRLTFYDGNGRYALNYITSLLLMMN